MMAVTRSVGGRRLCSAIGPTSETVVVAAVSGDVASQDAQGDGQDGDGLHLWVSEITTRRLSKALFFLLLVKIETVDST